MKRFRIRTQPAAEAHLVEIAAWWEEHRPEHPHLVVEELGEAIQRLEGNPEAGAVVLSRRLHGVRRLLLPRSQYYMYYRVDHERRVIRIEAVWRASRGKGPPLK
jgi:plasmid stabilization system protein ParE